MAAEPRTKTGEARLVVAIVVAYCAEQSALNRQLKALSGQVDRVVLIVNPAPKQTTDLQIEAEFAPWVDLITQSDNVGLPAAQNTGIAHARALGATSVLFLDQDSIPSPNMVLRLEDALAQSDARGERTAAVGPVYEQPEGAPWRGFVTISWKGFRRNPCVEQQDTVRADFLISSGTLVRMAVLNAVGELDGSLFIDHADTEWCLRARHLGYELRGVCTASMQHTLGDSRQRIWWFGERSVSHHAPFRHYYMFRNSMLLCRRPYIPLHWKVWDGFRSIRLLVFMAVFAGNKKESLSMMWRGWRDGLKGVTGPMPSP